MTDIRLSILDQSVVRMGSTPAEALQETIETAILAEQWGYHRFWVSEHHNSTFIAGSAPEILIARLGSVTQRLRVGSGGVMLPNHSAFKVAENFRLLESLFPGRIDLGIGRAPGGDRVSAMLLNPANDFAESRYISQIEHLQRFFRDTAESQYGPVRAVPQATTIPGQWILSSSGGSSELAARFGLGLVIARFINGQASPEISDTYRRLFRPFDGQGEPEVFVAISAICAETEEKAAQMRKHLDFILLQFAKGNYQEFPSLDEIRAYRFSPSELEIIGQNSSRIISGTPDQVEKQISELAQRYSCSEVMVSTMGDTKENRRKSFELLAGL